MNIIAFNTNPTTNREARNTNGNDIRSMERSGYIGITTKSNCGGRRREMPDEKEKKMRKRERERER